MTRMRRTSSIILAQLCWLISCGKMGTEVGNGNRPKTEKSTTTTNASQPDVSTGASAPARDVTFDASHLVQALLSTACAGPFREALTSPLTILPPAGNTAALPLQATLTDDTWRLTQGTVTVSLSIDGSDGNRTFTCDAPTVETTPENLIHHRVVYHGNGQSYTNEWWVSPAASLSDLPRLVRITLTSANGDNLVTETPGS